MVVTAFGLTSALTRRSSKLEVDLEPAETLFAWAALGLAPENALESAFQASFIPGEYTAILSNNAVEAGVGLVEAYHVD